MRAGPLSNAEVVTLLNSHFVAVYLSNEDYARKDGAAPPEEKAEYGRIYKESLQTKLSTGTVHAYVLNPDGHPVDSLHVATAANVEALTEMLRRAVARFGTPAGGALVPPRPQSAAVSADREALVLHLTSRYLTRKGKDLVPLQEEAGLGRTRNASWSAAPGEDWITLSKDEWARLLPAGTVKPGGRWQPDRRVVEGIVTHFYPATENNDIEKNQIENLAVTGHILSLKDGVAHARLDGGLKMKHPFYHKDDPNRVEATFIGILEFDVERSKPPKLHIATSEATYARQHFGVAVRTVRD